MGGKVKGGGETKRRREQRNEVERQEGCKGHCGLVYLADSGMLLLMLLYLLLG